MKVSSRRIKNKWHMASWFLFLAMLVLIGCGNNAPEQKKFKIGILAGFDPFIDIANGFKTKMTELGYVEGQNIVYDLQKVQNDRKALSEAIRKFMDEDIDLLLTFPTEATIRAKELTRGSDIPIVFAMAGIEGNDLVKSISHPGGNITGIRFLGPDIIVKRFELLHDLVPQAKRIWIAYDPQYPTIKSTLEVLRPSVAAVGVTLVEAAVTSIEDIRNELQAHAGLKEPDIDAILIMPDLITQSQEGWTVINQFAQAHKIPIAGGGIYSKDAKTVLNYHSDYFKIGKQAASMADKILKGTPAGTIMVATPQSRLWLNYKLAQELGLTVPEGLLGMADEVIR